MLAWKRLWNSFEKTQTTSFFFLTQTEDGYNNIRAALGEIQSKSCIRFKMRDKDDDNWIRFVNKSG